jgi:hypothetical protein
MKEQLQDLAICLHFGGLRFEEMAVEVRQDLAVARRTMIGIDHLEGQIDGLMERTRVKASLPPSVMEATSENPQDPISEIREISYNQCLHEAALELRRRGMDLENISPESILDRASYEALRNRFEVSFSLEAQLDKYDLGFLFLAGLAGALVDWLVVKVPKGTGFLGGPKRDASPLTSFLRNRFAMEHDNSISDRFKVAYDAMPSWVPGMNPSMHRFHSLGHDPLVGMAVGVFDILRGGATLLDANGKLHFFSSSLGPEFNPVAALFYHLGHLLSDAFTPMGLPVPGWTLLNAFSKGQEVYRERTVGNLAQIMYRQGYDLRHFFTMATAPAAVELILAAYFIFRSQADEQFRDSQIRQIVNAGGKTYLSSERYTAMSLLAHLIVASSNGIRVSAQGPLALNYPQWLRFVQALALWLKRRMMNPSDILLRGLQSNSRMLLEGWMSLEDSDFPVPKASDFLT